MTIKEIKAYLREQHITFENEVIDELERSRMEAIQAQDEALANELWCLGQIYYIQKSFVAIYNSLKFKRYESAWDALKQADRQLSALEQNFDIDPKETDPFHLVYIKGMLTEYEKLFPYEYFIGREALIREEECSICGQPIRLRGGCGHKMGKLYMGELCVHKITKVDYLDLVGRKDPFDRSEILKPYEMQYNYEILNTLMANIHSPYDFWYVEVVKERNPEFAKIQRNDPCPCGSGKKFKHCCMNDPEKGFFDHYKLRLMNEMDEMPDRPMKIIKY